MKRLLLVVASIALAAACGGSSGTSIGGDSGASDGSTNPPGCPAASPVSGEACALAAGTRCDYGCALTATCNGTWSVLRSEIDCALADAGRDAPPPADGPFACGSATCGAASYCIRPCCGGVGPACLAKPDGGTCPTGTHPAFCTPLTGGAGENCQEEACTPPPPYCADTLPSGCSIDAKTREVICVCA
jgi:hypothetical protein